MSGVGAVLEPGAAADVPRGCKTKDSQKNAHLAFALASICAPLDVLCRFPLDVAAQGQCGVQPSSSLCGSLYISTTFFIAHSCLLEANTEGYL